ncbi:G protein beta subunit-like protein [Nematocida displodere]|uniref:G protein beta subunit-like protein n=1 Tax=Nematocida displodere TaxID=1805483 RepID=A0A177EI42_9MICR|nr:G protein beta subunit-like protein [Nematocida displodere]
MLLRGTLQGHAKAITSSAVYEGILYTTSEDGFIKGWDVRCEKAVRSADAKVPVYSAVVCDGVFFYADYSGFVHRMESLVQTQVSNCPVSLAESGGELFGYDKRGRVHQIDRKDLSFATVASMDEGYGLKCIAREEGDSGFLMALASSAGVGLVRGRDASFSLSFSAPLPEWCWDLAFSGTGEELLFVCSDGSMRSLPLASSEASCASEKSGASVVFVADYPLKALRVSRGWGGG